MENDTVIEQVSETIQDTTAVNNMVDGDTSPFAPYIGELKQFANDNPDRYELVCNTEARQLGCFRADNLTNDMFLVGAKNHQFVNILDNNGKYEVVSPLRFIQAFGMSGGKETKAGKADVTAYNEKSQLAIEAFNTFVTQSMRAKDAVRIKQPLEQWKFILDRLTDRDAKQAMKNVRRAIECKNTIAIKMTAKLYEELRHGQQSLFGMDSDVNEYVKSTFAQISREVKQKFGEAYIAIYQIDGKIN